MVTFDGRCVQRQSVTNRHRDGMFSSEQWVGWNNYYVASLTNQFSAKSWAEVREWYADDFRSHVDSVYVAK